LGFGFHNGFVANARRSQISELTVLLDGGARTTKPVVSIFFNTSLTFGGSFCLRCREFNYLFLIGSNAQARRSDELSISQISSGVSVFLKIRYGDNLTNRFEITIFSFSIYSIALSSTSFPDS